MLKGKDIHKWKILYKNIYLIHSFDGLDTKKEYPSIYKFLYQFKDNLKKRSDQGKYWYNLRACAYDDLFEKEKLIYPNIASGLYPVYDDSKYFTNQKCFILTSKSINLKYLNGLMASNVLNFIFSLIGSNLGSKGFDINKIFVEQLPIIKENTKTNDIIYYVENLIMLNNEITLYEDTLFKYIKNHLNIIKLTKKLENFYNLSEKEFINEIKKNNKNFDKINLLNIFNNSKNNIINLQEKIEIEENNLNTLVYEIYNLNSAEIEILEKHLK